MANILSDSTRADSDDGSDVGVSVSATRSQNRSIDSRPSTRFPHRAQSAALPSSGVSPDAGVRRILSAELFATGVVVEIEHEGAIYRLRHTRKGKLILTK